MELLIAVSALMPLALAILLWRRARRSPRRLKRVAVRLCACVLLLVALALVVDGGYSWWFVHRAQPLDTRRTLYEGVTFVRQSRRQPRPIVICALLIDLKAPGMSFLVTPGERVSDGDMRARTTSRFLRDFGVQVAVNAGDFAPWWSRGILDYYPHAGDPVRVAGFSASRGNLYSGNRARRWPTMYLSRYNRVDFYFPVGVIYNAVTGIGSLLQNGRPNVIPASAGKDLAPRTAFGLDREGRTLIVLVVDGRQPNYSEGVTLAELAGVVREFGAYTAINMDGGGSTALVMRDASGNAVQLNTPIDHHIAGCERPVANHLGIWARPLSRR
jgi:hypothetical protein